ncbi:hypothetical protein [Negadavirga shengliensis]|uniref:Tetratricopeptide repeat protein n=1 Tax=Negadavirga shengliensis TaxID=1389218 RepID=A0ABV9T428_9BACT
MNAQKLISLINKGNQLDKEDFKASVKLHEDFPYFLIPKVLAAKYEMEKSAGQSKELLHWAAVLSPDRRRLKQLIEKPLAFLAPDHESMAEREAGADTLEKKRALTDEPGKTTDSASADGPSSEHDPSSEEENEEDEKEKEPTKPDRNAVLKRLEENLNKIKEASIKKNDELQNPQEDRDKTTPPIPSVKEDLISSIKKKKKLKLLDEKIKEQNSIIKSFHEKPIRLSAEKIHDDEYEKLPDLSEKSTVLNDNTVSESFAKLLIRQNKKTAAAEIYQKLMLKFPDKKAYFADQIAQLNA